MNSIRTTAPFKIGQRDSGGVLTNVGLQDLRIYARNLTPEEARSLAEIPRMKWLATRRAPVRTTNENDELFALWINRLDAPYREALAEKPRLAKEAEDIRKRGTVAYVMQDKTNAPEAYVLTSGAIGSLRPRRRPCRPCGPTNRATAWASPNGWCVRIIP
jgi:hypothetical protein